MSERLEPQLALALNALVAVVYAGLGVLALSIASVGFSVPFWPAAGIAFAFVYRWGPILLPGVFVGSVVAEIVSLSLAGVGSWLPSPAAVAIAVGAAGGAMAGGALVHRFVDDHSRLDNLRDIATFLLLAGPVAACVSATFGSATQAATGVLNVGQVLDAWLVWWVGDAIGIMVFGPLTLMLLPDLRWVWEGRRWAIAIPSVGVCAVLVTIVVVNGSNERTQVATARSHAVEQAAELLEHRLDGHLRAQEVVKDQQLAKPAVTAAQFRAATAPLLAENPGIQALSWNPVVDAGDRAAFERSQRAQPGLAEYTITQRDAVGDLVPADARAQYVPVQYIEPLTGNEAAVGFDVASNRVRLEAVRAATDSAAPAATAPIDLVQDTGTRKGILVLTPTYRTGSPPGTVRERRAEIAGFATGVYRAEALLDLVYSDSAWDDLTLRLVDTTGSGEPVLLAARDARAHPTADPHQGAARPVATYPIEVFGRTWTVEMIPVAGDLVGGGGRLATFVLLVALLGVFVFEAIVLLITGLERRARTDATQKSYEATHDALTGAVNRRGFIDQLQRLFTDAEADRASHVLLFADLDRFKQVNDRAGHEAGDRMLIAVATALQGKVRAGDTVARIGGDEFAVILRDCSLDSGEQVADAIVEAVDEIRLQTPAGVMSVGVSVGLTAFGHGHVTDPGEALRRADEAAYHAKSGNGSPTRRHPGDGDLGGH